MNKFAITAFAAAMTVTVPAQAAETIFDNRAAFDAATGGGLTFESFEVPGSTAASRTFGALTVTETGGTNFVFTDDIIGATDGTRTVNIDDNGSSLFTFTFAMPISAFGGDFLSSSNTTVTFSGGASGSFALPATGSTFWGVISDTSFTSLTFDASDGPVYGVDALSYGTAAGSAVPEPATWALMLLGFFGIGGMMRRRGQGSVSVSYS